MGISEAQVRLIRRAAEGDASAMELFLLAHRRDLLRYLDRRIPPELRQVIEPQDVLQDVYLDVFRNMQTFDSSSPGMAVRWLIRVARNRVIDLLRMQQATKRDAVKKDGFSITDQVTEDSVVQLLHSLGVSEQSPSRSAAAKELAALLERCLAQLPEDHQQAIRYRYLEELPIDEVSQRMNRTSGSVLMLCHRGLKALRSQLRGMSKDI